MKLASKIFFNLSIIFFTLVVSSIEKKSVVDFGDYKSSTLTLKCWQALENDNFSYLTVYFNKCIKLYEAKAEEQQKELSKMPDLKTTPQFWALNDVATCYFIMAKYFDKLKKYEEVIKYCNIINKKYFYAQCFDNKSASYWKIGDAAKDLLLKIKSNNIDFEDYTSATLTKKAWQMLNEGKYEEALIYSNKCLKLYEKNALSQQKVLASYPNKEEAFNFWALNDIGTCLYIAGEAYTNDEQWQKAVGSYQKLISKYKFSQCWDARGWFWKPAIAARGKLNKIKAEQGVY